MARTHEAAVGTRRNIATIHEVAALAGVSPMTAARILAGKSPQSKSRLHVLKCAQELSYVRNQQAANLRTGRSRLIGVMVPFIDNPFYTKFLQEMHDALAECQYQSLIACSFGQGDSMLSGVHLFETYNVDGLVLDLSEGRMTPEVQERLRILQQRSRAVVVTGSQRHDLSYDHLYLDNHSAIEKVMRHLLARGHRRFGFVGGWAENPNIANRLDAFKSCLRSAELPVVSELISLGDPALGDVTQRMHRLLRLAERPTAIVCTSDMIAMIAVKAARETGLRVPQDLAVTGFDDIELANLLNPALTTVRQPLNFMAREIVKLVLHRLDAIGAPFEEKRFQADLVIREST